MIAYTGFSVLAGFLLDLLFGDPYWMPHPVKAMGRFIQFLEKKLLDEKADPAVKRRRGLLLVILLLLATALLSTVILAAAFYIHPLLGFAVSSFLCYQVLAAKCLKQESMKVYDALEHKTLEEARHQVSMIVGRDTSVLDDAGVTRAAVETVAENTSDGETAPMLYLVLGGPVLGLVYKAVNTMDSMIGYKNERYLDFGRAAARLDDIVNYIPARLSAWMMILASFFCGLDSKNALRIYRRDRRNHASPNSAHTESVCAGALHIRLAGDAWYFGKLVKKPYIGDGDREVEHEDIRRVNRLLYGASVLQLILLLAVRGAVVFVLYKWGVR